MDLTRRCRGTERASPARGSWSAPVTTSRECTSARASSTCAASAAGCTSRSSARWRCSRRSGSGAAGAYESDLGEVEVFPPERIEGLEVVRVSVGNPHAVVLGDPNELPRIGPLLETHPRFPERTNVQVARIEGPGEVSARVWERGVGDTTASGSSAVAVAAATHGEGEVLVRFPGGDLRVDLHDGRATLIGPAQQVE